MSLDDQPTDRRAASRISVGRILRDAIAGLKARFVDVMALGAILLLPPVELAGFVGANSDTGMLWVVLRAMAAAPKDMRVRMLGGTHVGYARLVDRWWQPIGGYLADHDLLERPVYFVSSNPLSIVAPCHRVIGADGSLTGYGGKIWRKQWLLEHERRVATTLSKGSAP